MEYKLTIGQVAEATGVTAKTIRYYEQVGVLPAASRGASGYRLYDQSGVERLKFIHRARSLGLPLQQLRTLLSLLNGQPRAQVRPRLRALVEAQLGAVTEQIAQLEVLRQQLEQVFERMRTPVSRRAGEACQCLEPAHVPAERRRRAGRRSGGSGTRR